MALLQKLGTGQGYLKAGFLGFPKSGKTYTATLLACGTHNMMAKNGRIVMFDTEGGSEYIAQLVMQQSGQELLGVRSRSLADLLELTKELQQDDILVVDSVTHVWRELCDAHLAGINTYRKRRGWDAKTALEFQDWSIIKKEWAKWTDWYLNSKVHCIICGRAGYEYEFETTVDDRGREKKELIKTGTKMKTESEFGFEPSLLVEMFRDDVIEVDGKKKKVNQRYALIRGDRFAVIDGDKFPNPTFDSFRPHVELLKPGAHAPIDMSVKTDTGSDEDDDGSWQKEKKARTILCEEIQGLVVQHVPGQSAQDKAKKQELFSRHFGTRSWTAIEGMQSGKLRDALKTLREELEPVKHPEEPHTKEALIARISSAKTEEEMMHIRDAANGLPDDDLGEVRELLAMKMDLMAPVDVETGGIANAD